MCCREPPLSPRSTNGAIRVNYYDNWIVRLLLVKLFWVSWRIIVPLVCFQMPAKQLAAVFIVSELASGYWLAFNFQV